MTTKPNFRKDVRSKHMLGMVECVKLVYEHFNDWDKTDKWFRETNPLLGNVPPLAMIGNDRTWKLLKFIKQLRNESAKKSGGEK